VSKGARRLACSAARQGYPAVASVVMLLLILAPGLLLISAADAQPSQRPAEPERTGGLAVSGGGRASSPGAGTAALGGASDGVVASAGSAAPASASPDRDGGITLLHQAVGADEAVPYRGVRMICWWGPRGTTTVVENVAHQPGSGTLLQMAGTGAQPAAAAYVPDTPGIRQPGTPLGVTDEALGLLAANYRVVQDGTGSAGGRPAEIVEARRGDGTVAARFWLDQATKMPLRRELFDRNSRMINEDAFIDLEVGRSAVGGVLDGQAAPSRPWSDELASTDLARLRASGWPLPGRLPGGLSLFEARQTVTASGTVLQLGYSDGVSGVSLFIQRGGLPRTLAGYQKALMDGHAVYVRDSAQQLLTWAGRGHVYTVIADAPAGTVDAVVGALPHDPAPGFWKRISRGFTRLASWADPFR
jgi:sigma-E factor negative regulatory protein RseB